MQMINTLFTEELVEALGWTVLHSLWQAAIVAVALAFFMLIGRGKPARLRYAWANIALLVVFALAVFTFVRLYEQTPAQLQVAELSVRQAGPQPALAAGVAADMSTFRQRFTAYFEMHLPLIVALWLAGMCLFLLRLLGGLAYVQRLKYSQVSALGEEWQGMLRRLSSQLGMRVQVQLVESALARGPMVVGHIKPFILLPIGAVNQLSPEQVEAVLAHELAHIFRNDYLWNIVQSAVEIALYFNPAVWWISAVIRDERESSCDDLAVALCGN
ncbi:MAG: M48 family metalloprotease, partial [Saprospiraceae bacterium]|nr:M48 family metalloprotease [Saprospiraceae bacterium]